MHPYSQINPESPSRPPPSKYAISGSTPPNQNLAFLSTVPVTIGHSLREVRESDQQLEAGIQDTRARLLAHLKVEQPHHEHAGQVEANNNRYRNIILAGSAGNFPGKAATEKRIIVNNYYTPVAQSGTIAIKNTHTVAHTHTLTQ